MLSVRIKSETLEEHQQAEAQLLPFLNSIQTRAQYIQLLQSFLQFYQPFENLIHAALTPEQLPDLHERRHAHRLLSDLRELNAAEGLLPVPVRDTLTAPGAWGALYVQEGSTLGGQYISRLLLKNEALRLTPAQVSFFSGYGSQTGTRWKLFQESLNKQRDEDAIIAAAKHTFLLFQNHLNATLNFFVTR